MKELTKLVQKFADENNCSTSDIYINFDDNVGGMTEVNFYVGEPNELPRDLRFLDCRY